MAGHPNTGFERGLVAARTDVSEKSDRRRAVVSSALAAVAFGAFLLYYGLLCFRGDWGGDFQIYCAMISRLYDDLLHPAHEAIAAPGTQSALYTLYLVVWGALGRAAGVTPYRILQIAGCVNLIVFGLALIFFASRQSIHRHYAASAACLLFANLFLRWRHFGWSSDTSLTSLQYIQSYPSTMGWGLAWIAFGAAGTLVSQGGARRIAGFVALLAVLLLTHVLTASWVMGIVAVLAIAASTEGGTWRPLARVGWVFALALLAVSPWPYLHFWGQRSLTNLDEGAPFGKAALADFPSLYAIAFPCWAYLLYRFRKHGVWVLGFLATLVALSVWHRLGISFGNRYSLYAAFLAQFAVAEVMALGIFALVGPLSELEPTRPLPWIDRPFALLVLAASCLAWIPSPMVKRARTKGELGSLDSPLALLERPSPHDAYYRRFGAVTPRIAKGDIVMTPQSRDVFDLASITGASVVSSPHALVPDSALRASDVKRFFTDGTPSDQRAAIVRHYRSTKVLLPRESFQLADALEESFGAPAFRDDRYTLWDLGAAP